MKPADTPEGPWVSNTNRCGTIEVIIALTPAAYKLAPATCEMLLGRCVAQWFPQFRWYLEFIKFVSRSVAAKVQEQIL